MIEFAVVGFFVGALSRLTKPGKQHLRLPTALVLGLTGSILSALVAPSFGAGALFELNAGSLIVALTGAILLIGIAETIAGRHSS